MAACLRSKYFLNLIAYIQCVKQVSLSNKSFNPLQLPLSHPSQHPQRHVKLQASAPAVLGVEVAATSLLADVGVIELAVPTGTAVPISVQPAQEQVTSKSRLLRSIT